MPKEKLMSIEEFAALSEDEMMEYTKLVKGNSKTEDFQKATGLGFSYTTFANLLKEKGIYRSGSSWHRLPANSEKTISEGEKEVEDVYMSDLVIEDGVKKTYVFSKKSVNRFNEFCEKHKLPKNELVNLGYNRLLDDLENGKIDLHCLK